MSSLPKKCVVDTNVPIVANMSVNPSSIPPELNNCVLSCIEAIEHVIKKGGLIIDSGDEIFSEYRHKLLLKGQPGVGDAFLKWVHDNRWIPQKVDQVAITKNGDSYDEFPIHDKLASFHRPDRKFVAVANAHSAKPPILQATDSKWWGWKDALAEVGITVQFMCPQYVEKKFQEKMEY